MNAKGIINVTRRLLGARQLGSATLVAKAALDGRSTLEQAQIWLKRNPSPTTEEEQRLHQQIVEAVESLERVLRGETPCSANESKASNMI